MNKKNCIEIKPDISGFILAGGKSNRMGTDKALLMVHNEPLLKRMISLIKPFCNTIAISGHKADYIGFNTEIVPDLFSGCGPISGILSSLKHSSTEWNLFVSVDVPFINRDLIQYLISQTGEFDCIIPKHDGRVEPLIGLYNQQIIPVVEGMIESKDYKLMRLLSEINTCYVDCTDMKKQFPLIFTNINSPDDYHLFC